MFNSEQDAGQFFKFLNIQHCNIKFTFEKQKVDKLAFLDVLTSRTDQTFCTSIYHKMTSIGLYPDFVSFTRYSYKIGLIKTLKHCTYETSSSWTSFNKEICNIKHLLTKNIYPSYLIDKQVKRFLQKFPLITATQLKNPKKLYIISFPI